MKGICRIIVPVLLLTLACSRNKEFLPNPVDNGVSFALEERQLQGSVQTRADGGGVQELVSQDGLKAFVTGVEISREDIPTRASSVNAVSGITSFRVTAYDHAGGFGASTVSLAGGRGFENTTFSVTHSGSDYWGEPSPVRYWPISGRRMSFFSCVPDDAAVISLGTGFPSFTYTVPDALASQEDLLVASALDQLNTVAGQGVPGRAPLTFGHALSAVVFAVGDMGTNSDSGSLTISLTGLYNQNTFTYEGTSGSSSLGGSWGGSLSGNGTYAFTTNLHGTNAAPVDYSEISGSGDVMFLMPQSIPDGATLSISYTDPGGAVHRFSAQLNTMGVTAWAPGGLYRYTVSLSRSASLQVACQPWTVSGSSVRVDGPVTYDSGDTFGVYAVDAGGRIVFANVPMTATSSGSSVTLNPGDCYLSSTYTYYVYYPYQAGLNLTYRDSGVLLVPDVVFGEDIIISTVLPNAGNFFYNYVTGQNGMTAFAPAENQSSRPDFKASDLQTGWGGYRDGSFVIQMEHRESLAKFVFETEHVADMLTVNALTNETSTGSFTSVTPFTTFGTTAVPYRDGSTQNYYYIAKYNQKPSVADGSGSSTPKHRKWAVSPVVVQSASGGYLGGGSYREFVIRSRAAERGWIAYRMNFPYNHEKEAVPFTPLVDGTYLFECWGAQGGGHSDENPYGKGAYTAGEMAVTTSQTFYAYVGEYGGREIMSDDPVATTRTWNGGGGGPKLSFIPARYTENQAGGGATDIRTASGNWNANLGTRIMVAGGGGGASHGGFGGYGGAPDGGAGLRYIDIPGYDLDPRYNLNHDCRGKGGTRTAGGAAGHWDWSTGIAPTAGGNTVAGQVQGQGGDGNTAYGGGGGGGYWGGGGAGVESASMGGGGGGSSYVSSAFSNPRMVAGGAYTVVTATVNGIRFSQNRPTAVSQPQPDGTTASGHAGSGYARITLISE